MGVSSAEQMSSFKPFFSHMLRRDCHRLGSSLQTWPIMGKLFWTTEHEQNGLQIACFRIIRGQEKAKPRGEKSIKREGEQEQAGWR